MDEAISYPPETAVESQPVQVTKETKFCSDCGAEISQKAEICPKCGVRAMPTVLAKEPKSKTTAALLAIFLGGIGIHKFYLGGGSTKWGIAYLLLCWTFLPAILSLIEGIMFLTMDEAGFHQTYG